MQGTSSIRPAAMAAIGPAHTTTQQAPVAGERQKQVKDLTTAANWLRQGGDVTHRAAALADIVQAMSRGDSDVGVSFLGSLPETLSVRAQQISKPGSSTAISPAAMVHRSAAGAQAIKSFAVPAINDINRAFEWACEDNEHPSERLDTLARILGAFAGSADTVDLPEQHADQINALREVEPPPVPQPPDLSHEELMAISQPPDAFNVRLPAQMAFALLPSSAIAPETPQVVAGTTPHRLPGTLTQAGDKKLDRQALVSAARLELLHIAQRNDPQAMAGEAFQVGREYATRWADDGSYPETHQVLDGPWKAPSVLRDAFHQGAMHACIGKLAAYANPVFMQRSLSPDDSFGTQVCSKVAMLLRHITERNGPFGRVKGPVLLQLAYELAHINSHWPATTMPASKKEIRKLFEGSVWPELAKLDNEQLEGERLIAVRTMFETSFMLAP